MISDIDRMLFYLKDIMNTIEIEIYSSVYNYDKEMYAEI